MMKRMAVVAGAALFSLATIAPTAMAASPSTGSTWTVVATVRSRPLSSVTSTSLAGAASGGVVCSLELDYPHNSTHVRGTVNVVARVVCSSPVSSISLSPQLYPPVPYAPIAGTPVIVADTSSAQANAASTFCTNGTWQGWASWSVVFPPGDTPPTGSGAAFGPTAPITCPL